MTVYRLLERKRCIPAEADWLSVSTHLCRTDSEHGGRKYIRKRPNTVATQYTPRAAHRLKALVSLRVTKCVYSEEAAGLRKYYFDEMHAPVLKRVALHVYLTHLFQLVPQEGNINANVSQTPEHHYPSLHMIRDETKTGKINYPRWTFKTSVVIKCTKG